MQAVGSVRHLTLVIMLLVAITGAWAGCDSGVTPSEAGLDAQLREILEQAADGQGLSFFLLPSREDLPSIPQDPRNPLTQAKVSLGRLLFHEPGLAASPVRPEGLGTYACASCHHAGAGFQAGRRQGIGEGAVGFGEAGESRTLHPAYRPEEADVQRIRTPAVLNAAWQNVTFWSGQFGATGPNVGTEHNWLAGTVLETNRLGYEGLETQAIAALTAHRMAGGPAFLVARYPEYQKLFDAAFPDRPSDERVSLETAGLALAAFERTVVASQAPFQQWLRGEVEALTDTEKRGALVFFGEGRCVTCHTGPALSSSSFHALGMGDLGGADLIGDPDPADPVHLGRGGFTGRAEDYYRFKTPQLYNLGDHTAFGHGATFRSVRAVLDYKNDAVPENPYVPTSSLATHFRPLGLDEQALDDLTAFLERGLYDPDLRRHVPASLPSGACFPANDIQSRRDLGCDVAAWAEVQARSTSDL